MLVVAPVTACSSTRAAAGPLSHANVLTQAQLQQTTKITLYDALRGIHPEYFVARGRVAINKVPETTLLVYTKGMLLGEVDALAWIPVAQVASVRRLGVVETYDKYGRFTTAGALEIDFRRP